MKSRALNPLIITKSLSKFGRIIVLTGARQTGKTTLARKCFPEYQYLSIEDPITRGEYARLTSRQWFAEYPNAILDEVQKEPLLIESIKAVYDQFDEPRYILLGSSQFLLLQKVRESLAGRCSIFEVFPLTLPEMMSESWEEILTPSFFQQVVEGKIPDNLPPSFLLHSKHAKALSAFNHYLHFGGYPAIIDDTLDDMERQEWIHHYIRTFLERDIRDLAEFRNLEPFIRTQRTTALLTGSLVNYAFLAREADLAPHTARRFLQYLELSYQVVLLKPWARNDLKRLNKSPKLHYLDPGIQRGILRKQGDVSGNEFESAVIGEIYKQSRQPWFRGDLYHLRTVDGREVDLLIELENGYMAVEVKMSQRVTTADTRHLVGLQEILDKPLIHSFILSNDMHVRTLVPGITAIPAVMFLT